MTPWLRITRRCIPLLLVLAVALPAYDAVTDRTTTAHTGTPGPRSSTAPGPGSTDPGPADRPTPGDADHLASWDTDRPVHPGHPANSGRKPRDSAAQEPSWDTTGPDHDHDHGRSHSHGYYRSQAPEPSSSSPVPPMPSDSASASYHPTAVEPTRAGSRAGEGRMRPGRPDGPMAEVEGDDDPVPTPAPGTGEAKEPETADLPTTTPTASTVPDEAGLNHPPPQNAPDDGNVSQPVLQILPLGSGLVLIGIGLALAFLGLRLRKD
ncbi:hypothetical protein ACIBJF_07685 [Streptomyces sp. NPDC050743]|uniref:hypothetical protein n=1 Tax=Streptomyces sp. NPDC050743 TaxID=3365634 RepID=UPI00378D0CD4